MPVVIPNAAITVSGVTDMAVLAWCPLAVGELSGTTVPDFQTGPWTSTRSSTHSSVSMPVKYHPIEEWDRMWVEYQTST